MKKSPLTEEPMLHILRQVEADVPAVEGCRKLGMSEQNFSCWKR
jgi:hypothetical protein